MTDNDNRCPFYMDGDRCFASVGDEIRPEDMFGQREFRKCEPDAWTLVRCRQEAKRQEEAKDFDHPDFVPRPPQNGEKGKIGGQKPLHEIQPQDGEKELLQQQIEQAMPLVGELLDRWDELPNDVKADEELKPVARVIQRIDNTMEGEKGDAIFKRRVTFGNGTYLYNAVANERTGLPDRRVNEQPTTGRSVA